ncbi:MAG: hypothetical protein ACLTLQ_10895 [[Clostridium] scindens]
MRTPFRDQMVGYLNLEVKTGNMKLDQTSEDGKVEGISFTITGEGVQRHQDHQFGGLKSTSPDLNPGVFIP